MNSDTHKKLMYATIVLATIHAILSALVLFYDDKVTSGQRKTFLIVSIIVNILIVAYAYYCLQLKCPLEN